MPKFGEEFKVSSSSQSQLTGIAYFMERASVNTFQKTRYFYFKDPWNGVIKLVSKRIIFRDDLPAGDLSFLKNQHFRLPVNYIELVSGQSLANQYGFWRKWETVWHPSPSPIVPYIRLDLASSCPRERWIDSCSSTLEFDKFFDQSCLNG